MRSALAVAISVGLVACGQSEQAPEDPSQDLEAARRFDDFRLYFAGLRQADLDLTFPGIDRHNPYRRGRPVSFQYGSCTLPEGDEGGCAAPLAVMNFPARAENLGRYAGGMVTPARTLCLRGVRAGVFEAGGRFDKLLLTAGATTVAVRAESYDRARDVVAVLRSLDGAIPGRGLLPAPAREVRDRTGRPCAR